MKARLCLIFILIIMSSCTSQKKFAYDFVNKSKGAEVAFYVPDRLMKDNVRYDCQPENMEDVALEDVLDVIETRTRVVNKIDDDLFLDILISSFDDRIFSRLSFTFSSRNALPSIICTSARCVQYYDTMRDGKSQDESIYENINFAYLFVLIFSSFRCKIFLN